MKRQVFIFLIVVLASIFSGCTSYWYNPEKSFTQCRLDCTNCRIESSQYLEDKRKSNSDILKYEKKCMKEKGYVLIEEKRIPAECKKRKPDPIFREKIGIAGPLECDLAQGK